MKSEFRFFTKVCGIATATLMLSSVANAREHDWNFFDGWWHHDRDPVKEHRVRSVPVLPEANAGWVLIPFLGAVVLFSSRRLWLAKPTPKTNGQKAV